MPNEPIFVDEPIRNDLRMDSNVSLPVFVDEPISADNRIENAVTSELQGKQVKDVVSEEIKAYSPETDPQGIKAEVLVEPFKTPFDKSGGIYFGYENMTPHQQVDRMKRVINPYDQDVEHYMTELEKVQKQKEEKMQSMSYRPFNFKDVSEDEIEKLKTMTPSEQNEYLLSKDMDKLKDYVKESSSYTGAIDTYLNKPNEVIEAHKETGNIYDLKAKEAFLKNKLDMAQHYQEKYNIERPQIEDNPFMYQAWMRSMSMGASSASGMIEVAKSLIPQELIPDSINEASENFLNNLADSQKFLTQVYQPSEEKQKKWQASEGELWKVWKQPDKIVNMLVESSVPMALAMLSGAGNLKSVENVSKLKNTFNAVYFGMGSAFSTGMVNAGEAQKEARLSGATKQESEQIAQEVFVKDFTMNSFANAVQFDSLGHVLDSKSPFWKKALKGVGALTASGAIEAETELRENEHTAQALAARGIENFEKIDPVYYPRIAEALYNPQKRDTVVFSMIMGSAEPAMGAYYRIKNQVATSGVGKASLDTITNFINKKNTEKVTEIQEKQIAPQTTKQQDVEEIQSEHQSGTEQTIDDKRSQLEHQFDDRERDIRTKYADDVETRDLELTMLNAEKVKKQVEMDTVEGIVEDGYISENSKKKILDLYDPTERATGDEINEVIGQITGKSREELFQMRNEDIAELRNDLGIDELNKAQAISFNDIFHNADALEMHKRAETIADRVLRIPEDRLNQAIPISVSERAGLLKRGQQLQQGISIKLLEANDLRSQGKQTEALQLESEAANMQVEFDKISNAMSMVQSAAGTFLGSIRMKLTPEGNLASALQAAEKIKGSSLAPETKEAFIENFKRQEELAKEIDKLEEERANHEEIHKQIAKEADEAISDMTADIISEQSQQEVIPPKNINDILDMMLSEEDNAPANQFELFNGKKQDASKKALDFVNGILSQAGFKEIKKIPKKYIKKVKDGYNFDIDGILHSSEMQRQATQRLLDYNARKREFIENNKPYILQWLDNYIGPNNKLRPPKNLQSDVKDMMPSNGKSKYVDLKNGFAEDEAATAYNEDMGSEYYGNADFIAEVLEAEKQERKLSEEFGAEEAYWEAEAESMAKQEQESNPTNSDYSNLAEQIINNETILSQKADRISDMADLDSDTKLEVQNLADLYIRELLQNGEEPNAQVLLERFKEVLPDVSDIQLLDAFSGRRKQAVKEKQTEYEQLEKDLKQQSKLMAQIEEGMIGEFDAFNPPDPKSSKVVELQDQLQQLKNHNAKTETDPRKRDFYESKIDDLQNILFDYERLGEDYWNKKRKVQAEDSPEIRALKKKSLELQREIRTKEQSKTGKGKKSDEAKIADMKQQLDRIQTDIDNLKQGKLPEKVQKARETELVANMRKKVRELRALLHTEVKIKEIQDTKGDITKLKDLMKTNPRPVPTNQELIEKRMELNHLRRTTRGMIEDAKTFKDMSNWERITNILGATRTLTLSTDTPVLRQGKFTMWHGIGEAKDHFNVSMGIYGKTLKGGREAGTRMFNDLMFTLSQDSQWKEMQQAGLPITDPHAGMNQREEMMVHGKFAEKIPIKKDGKFMDNRAVIGSELAYSAYLNLERVKYYKALVRPDMTLEEKQHIARYVGAATGRGTFKAFERHALTASKVLLAPRWYVANMQMAGGIIFTDMFWKSDTVKKAWIRDVGTHLASRWAFIAVGAATGESKTGDPLDVTDPLWGKFQIGNTVIDPWGGSLWLPKSILSIIVDPENARSTVTRQAQYKLNPVLNKGFDIISGKQVTGQETDRRWATATAVSPIMVTNYLEAMHDGDYLDAHGQLMLDFMGGSSYIKDNKPRKKTKSKAKNIQSQLLN